MRKFALAMAITLSAAAGAQNADIQKEWPDFRYLEPKQVRELPALIKSDLEKRGCKIPKFTKWDARHNVIQGRFLQPAQQDWAVLCRHEAKSSILIYPGGATADVQMVRSEDHDPYRVIHNITAYVLQKRAVRDKLTESLPAFDHDGIEDGPIQKAAIVYYYRDGEWIEF
ncbi:MAG TPA: hypothetical protein VN664_09855 [Burkholderiales bacterium]|jgi:hypothetical protein|nr:hypothetical protein [Burkholderiales bacterium]